MKDIRIITGKNIIPRFDKVLGLLGCKKGLNPQQKAGLLENGQASRELIRQYETLLPGLRMRLQPKAAVAVGDVPKELENITGHQKLLYVMMTLGSGVERLCQSFFDKEDPFLGILCDAMADDSLFVLENQVLEQIRRMCREEGFGICKRLEAPGDIPMKMQQTAYEVLEANRTLGISITSAYMLSPIKSMSFFLVITEDNSIFQVSHSCKNCGSKTCSIRNDREPASDDSGGFHTEENVTVKLQAGDWEKEIQCKSGSMLKDVLHSQNLFFPLPCGGMGKCGKCKIEVTHGNLPVTLPDKNNLKKEELEKGIRLLCQAKLQEDVSVRMVQREYIVSEGRKPIREPAQEHSIEEPRQSMEKPYGVAVDLGTTTLAFSLMDLENSRMLDFYTCMNPQQTYGADVMSRIRSSNQGMAQAMKSAIQHTLCQGIRKMLEEKEIPFLQLRQIVISGNTTMIHLLRGYSCQGLAKSPFTPVSLKQEILPAKEVLGCSDFNSEAVLLPGASAFIGGDIVSGLFACGWNHKKETALFLDLGTNGEMALGNENDFHTASTAAGPAFEGGNITCGIAGIPGAICGADMAEGQIQNHTILDKPPVGICGTGIIEIVAELRRAGIIDAAGKLSEEYFEEGFPVAKGQNGEMIRIYQQDIRQLQLAKAAIRAGIELLIEKRGIGYPDIQKVYLAGGFGFYLDKEKAAAIGLLPKELVKKAAAVGNTSLKGGECYLTGKNAGEDMMRITERAREVTLAEEPGFSERYLEYMDFPLPD